LSNNIIVHEKPIAIQKLKFKDFDLQEVDLTNKKGNIMILNFWATWCLPCKREMPSLEKLANDYPEIKIFPINMEKPNKLKTRDFYNNIGIVNLDIYYDSDFELVKQFKMRGLPTSILIDKNGNEFGRIVGEIDFSSKEFLNFIKKYI
jgi:thiol-disulfide isomerase/thioredoxin|tara:strand:- start:131 stop:574 length:444 start_codon:yes stop_codon:yes gene_type:complete